MMTLGEYLPILAQIACIKLAIIGNWNELYQSELEQPDKSCSIHSKMFADFRFKLYNDMIA